MGRADPLKSFGISGGDRKGEAFSVATLCENARFRRTCRQNRLKMERKSAPSPYLSWRFVDDLNRLERGGSFLFYIEERREKEEGEGKTEIDSFVLHGWDAMSDVLGTLIQ